MNRNLSPDEFAETFLDISPGAGQSFESLADQEARDVAGWPGRFEGIAGAENERRSVQNLPPLPDIDALLFGDEPDPNAREIARQADVRWDPPPGRLN